MSSSIIKNISIRHSGNVIIDTVAPTGSVSINGGNGYVKNKKVTLGLDAKDDTTGVKSVEIRNVDIELKDNGEESQIKYNFIPLDYEENLPWNLSDVEGIKKVEVKFIDYANNVSSFSSNSNVRKFFDISSEEIDGLTNIGNNIYTYSGDENKIYITKNYPKLLKDFEDELIVKIIDNNNVLFVATNLSSTSKVYYYLDGEFLSLNTFNSLIVDIASYDDEIYVALSNRELYKKDSSAWIKINAFSRDILHICGKNDYLYVVFNDSMESIIIYNGNSFQLLDIKDLFQDEEYYNSSSSSESSSLSSYTAERSTSSQTLSTSSSSEISRSTSSISVSESSSSSQVKSSSSSSYSSSSSSTEEESSGLSSLSSESISSASYLAQFSESSSSSPLESSSFSSESSSSSDLSSSISSSSSSGYLLDYGKLISNSMYINNIKFSNLKSIHTLNGNLLGRMLNIGDGWLRVIFYKDINRQYEIARSERFYWAEINKTILISGYDNISGSFDYISLFSLSTPHNFIVLSEGTNTSSESSLSSDSSSSNRSSSLSLDAMLGDGTEQDPFLIKSAENFVHVMANPSAYYKLLSNINMSSVDSSLMSEYMPIGTQSIPFSGVLDGNGFFIIGYNIDNALEDNVGLFGYTNGAVIKNVGLINCNVNGKDNVGALVGRAFNTSIQKCFVYQGAVSGNENIGGLVGYVDSNSDVINCYSRNNYLIGSNWVGGLVGKRKTSSNIAYCYSTSLNNSSALNKGGLIAGSVFDVDSGEIINSYWDIESTSLSSSDGGVGRSSSNMKVSYTYFGWDFGVIWSILSNINDQYPYLKIFPLITTENSSSSSTETLDLSSESSSSTLYIA